MNCIAIKSIAGVFFLTLILIGPFFGTSATAKSISTISEYGNENYFEPSLFSLQQEIKIPELITPNGDGKNDVWEIIGIENYTKTKVSIFNRWGNKVYEMEQYDNKWEGKANRNLAIGDSKLSSGTYYYLVELDDELFKGFVFLAR